MKEIVHGDMPYGGERGLDLGDGNPPAWVPIRSVVEVRWDREQGYFQIATKALDAITGSDVLVYPSELRRMGPEPTTSDQAAAQEAQEASAIVSWAGYYTTLDRRGINDLIRKLRRARDQAFGRDE